MTSRGLTGSGSLSGTCAVTQAREAPVRTESGICGRAGELQAVGWPVYRTARVSRGFATNSGKTAKLRSQIARFGHPAVPAVLRSNHKQTPTNGIARATSVSSSVNMSTSKRIHGCAVNNSGGSSRCAEVRHIPDTTVWRGQGGRRTLLLSLGSASQHRSFKHIAVEADSLDRLLARDLFV